MFLPDLRRILCALAVASTALPVATAQGAAAQPASVQGGTTQEEALWKAAIDCASIASYLQQYPSGRHLPQALDRLDELACPATARGSSGVKPPAPAAKGDPAWISPAMVEVTTKNVRQPLHGGSAVVLLASARSEASKNAALCRAMFERFDTATYQDILDDRRIGLGGLRPIYWTVTKSGVSTCASRLERYDYERARRIRTQFRLRGQGPYLLVVNENDGQAAVLDLSTASAAQLDTTARYFALEFSQLKDVWGNMPTEAQIASSLARMVGGSTGLARNPFQVLASAIFGSSCVSAPGRDLC
jgi:hypothetical protein